MVTWALDAAIRQLLPGLLHVLGGQKLFGLSALVVLPACLTGGEISKRCRLLCGSGSSSPYRARNLHF